MPDMDGFPSGQRGQTVNLLQIASVVRIHLHPFALMSSMERCLARKSMQSSITQCVRWCGGIGRRKGLKIPRGQLRAGSSPATSILMKSSKPSKYKGLGLLLFAENVCKCMQPSKHQGFSIFGYRNYVHETLNASFIVRTTFPLGFTRLK